MGTIADQCKQRGVLCHIGLVMDHDGHLVNQSCCSVFEKCWKTTLENQISTIRKTNKHRTWWRKCTDESACLFYTDEWIKLNWKNLVQLRICLNKIWK